MTRNRVSRRRILALAGTTAAAGLAGCSSSESEPTATSEATATDTATTSTTETDVETETVTESDGTTATETLTETDGTTETVALTNSTFDPMRLSIDPGTTVEWVNEDAYGHDVTSAQFHDSAAQWEYSERLSSSGETVSHTFESEGVYEYYCTIHGKSTMCGVVLVGDASLDAALPCETTGSDGGY